MIQPSIRSCSGAEANHVLDQNGWDHHRAVVVNHDKIVRIDGDAAAADGFLPIDEGESSDRGRSGGALAPDGKAVLRTPAMSRTTSSVTSPATPRCLILAQRMSPKMPASVTPIASAIMTHPGGASSIAALVERGEDHEGGVARSSRAGMKRKVKACPIARGCPGRIGLVPRIQTWRNRCLSRMVVIVAVDTGFRASMMSLSSLNIFSGWTRSAEGRDGAREAGRSTILDRRFAPRDHGQ